MICPSYFKTSVLFPPCLRYNLPLPSAGLSFHHNDSLPVTRGMLMTGSEGVGGFEGGIPPNFLLCLKMLLNF